MIDAPTLRELASLKGKLSYPEGDWLARTAATVPRSNAIVEVGSYLGKSACFLGTGSRAGQSAAVFAIDLWEMHGDRHYGKPEVFKQWQQQVSQSGLMDLITPIRAESISISNVWSRPIGLLFVDADHSYEAVRDDFLAWSPHVVPGGWIALHDYRNPIVGTGVTQVVDRFVKNSDEWGDVVLIDKMLVARRSHSQAGGPADAKRRAGVRFVSNSELETHLQSRPDTYFSELAPAIVERTCAGILVDTRHPVYSALKTRYGSHAVDATAVMRARKPVADRLSAGTCSRCQWGAGCQFARRPRTERAQLLQVRHRRDMATNCPAKVWGQVTDFVYPYVAEPARGDELRFSLRSLESNFLGELRVWVIGDRPKWYRGRFISCPRIAPHRHRSRLDRANKLQRVLDEPEVSEEFVWMMDDIYLNRPVTIEDFRVRRSIGTMTRERLSSWAPKSVWGQEKRLTFLELQERNRPIDDYATHLPSVYDKALVRHLIRDYQLLSNPYVDDLLYFNEFATAIPRPASEVLYREMGRPEEDEIRRKMASAMIANHDDSCYTPAFRNVLQKMFPSACTFE